MMFVLFCYQNLITMITLYTENKEIMKVTTNKYIEINHDITFLILTKQTNTENNTINK